MSYHRFLGEENIHRFVNGTYPLTQNFYVNYGSCNTIIQICFVRIDTFVPLIFAHVLRINLFQLSNRLFTNISLIKFNIT